MITAQKLSSGVVAGDNHDEKETSSVLRGFAEDETHIFLLDDGSQDTFFFQKLHFQCLDSILVLDLVEGKECCHDEGRKSD